MAKQAPSSPPTTPPASSVTEALSPQTSPCSESTASASSLHEAENNDHQQQKKTPIPDLPRAGPKTERPTVTPEETFQAQVSPAQWMLPTSGELAFLAGLPVPTVRPDDDVHDGDNKGKEKEASTFNARDSPAGARSHFLDDPVSGSAISPSSLPGPTEILAASSRRWTGNFDGSVVHRRDTWVVGEKWGRHVRVIDVGSRRTPGPGNRKSSE